MKHEIQYFESYDQDFVESADQTYTLPENYVWMYDRPHQKLTRSLLRSLFGLFSEVYIRGIHHLRYGSIDCVRHASSAGILYLNHTQPVIDPFLPHLLIRPRKSVTVCAPSNLGIPVLGKILPLLGAVPTGSTLDEMRHMKQALQAAADRDEWIVIYPEAHVWPWCTWIRPFDDTSFQFCLDFDRPAYCGVLTYRKMRNGKCQMVIETAGPFYADHSLPRRKARRQLHQQVFEAMQNLASRSTCEKIQYQPAKPEHHQ